MKRSLFVVFCLATMVYAVAAYAADGFADCVEMQCPLKIEGSSETYSVLGQDATGCNRYYKTCYECNGNWKVYNCDSCKSGYTHSTETIKISQYTSKTVGQCTKNMGLFCETTNYYGSDYPEIKGCTSTKAQKFGSEIVSTCEKCETGWFLREQEMSVDGCSNKYTYKTCRKGLIIDDCNSKNCSSDLLWSSPSAGANYVTKTNRSCNGNRCMAIEVYSCAGGYYGTASVLSQDCHACPDGGKSTPGDNTVITKCFSTGGKDAAGDYKFEPDCYYTGQ